MRVASIPSLTGIRGTAAVVVVLFHLHLGQMYGLGQDPLLVRNGGFGVDLFFVLSGFILAHVHLNEFQHITKSALIRFAGLRFFRVYPLHVTVLLAIAAWVIANPSFTAWIRSLPGQEEKTFTLGAFLQTLTLTNHIGLPSLGDYNVPSWSLSAELLGYAAFPFLAWGILRIAKLEFCVTVMIVSLIGFVVSTSLGHMGVTRMMFCFPAGMVLARIAQLIGTAPRWASMLATLSASEAIIALSTDSLAPFAVFGFAGMILGLALSDRGPLSTFLSSRPMMFLGRISFSLYLTHLIVQWLILWLLWGGDARATPTLAVCLLVTANICVATVFYQLVELPSHQYGRAFAKRFARAKPERQLQAAPDARDAVRL